MQVLPFSEANLALSLSNDFTSPGVIKSKNHFRYLVKYLSKNGLKALSIVIEEKYVSKDYLHDYASYYAYCFKPYPKFCKRIHFFSNKFSQDEFEDIVISDTKNNSKFWSNYLGFVVVKPIPVTVIGYTILKTYSNKNLFNERNFWGTRQYKIHLYGNELSLCSLAFQEQDSVLAACATTAIWSMLNKAAIDFHTILKSPNQITKDADNVSPDGSRLFPNKGLNLLQICQAIVNSGLVSEIKQADYALPEGSVQPNKKVVSNGYLKKILNAYSPIGIPLILIISVPSGQSYGLHAITVSGFKQAPPLHSAPKNEISWLAENIEKFYAHDDQWGPFVRIDFEDEVNLITPWTINDISKRPTNVTNIVVPIYPKIRITYLDIEGIVLGLDRILTFFFSQKIRSDLVWDIKIDYSENFKRTLKDSQLSSAEKKVHLNKSLSKYLWIATCYISHLKVFEFTFDATDVNNGMIGQDFISYVDSDLKKLLLDFLMRNKSVLQTLIQHQTITDYYDFLIERLTDS